MRRRIPSTQSLLCFESAARQQSFTSAARELALTQSAVCRQIASLEDFLGVKLFRRSQRGVALTRAGAQYARQVKNRLDAVERDALTVMSGRGAVASLELAVVPTFATRWLLPRLPDFRRKHPDIVVHLEVETRPFLFTDTTFDAALYGGTPANVANWPGTASTLLLKEDVYPVCSPRLITPRERLKPNQIAKLPLLQQSTRPFGWREWFDSQGLSVPDDLAGARFELFSMLAVAASHGMGVALIPPFLIEDELHNGRLIVAADRPLRGERGYYFIVPESGAGNVALSAFQDWLIAEARTNESSPNRAPL